MEFKVLTSILPRAHNPAHACLNTTNTYIFHEPFSDSYAIDLSHYRYAVVSSLDNSGTTSHNITSEGFVHDLPGFQYINQDCEATAFSDSSMWVSSFTTLTIVFIACPVLYFFSTFYFPSFLYLYGRPQSSASSVPTCQPIYTFPLPDLPPHSALLLTYTANKRLLSREHQPIDASRGAVVPPAVLYACNALSGKKNMLLLHRFYNDIKL